MMRLQNRRAQFRNFATAAVGSERCRSQMIAEQVVHRAAALTHRRPLTAGVVVLDHRGCAAGPLEVDADGVSGHVIQYGFEAFLNATTVVLRYCFCIQFFGALPVYLLSFYAYKADNRIIAPKPTQIDGSNIFTTVIRSQRNSENRCRHSIAPPMTTITLPATNP